MLQNGSLKKVMFMGKVMFESHCKAIKSLLIGQHLNRRLVAAQKMEDEEEAEMEKVDIANQMAWGMKAIEAYKKLLDNITRH